MPTPDQQTAEVPAESKSLLEKLGDLIARKNKSADAQVAQADADLSATSPDVFAKEPAEPEPILAAGPGAAPAAESDLPTPVAENVQVRSVVSTFQAVANLGMELDAKAKDEGELAIRARNKGQHAKAKEHEHLAGVYQSIADRLHDLFTGK